MAALVEPVVAVVEVEGVVVLVVQEVAVVAEVVVAV